MRPLRIGFAGCGRAAAELHLPALARVAGVEAVAVADPDLARAREVAARFGIERVHSGADALAADDAVDVVAVTTPPAAHAQVAVTAAAAGRHLAIEKPLALTLDDADEMIAATEQAGVVAATMFCLRAHRQVAAARSALACGRLGRLLMLRTHWTAGPRRAGWRSDADQGGGVLWEMGMHHLDLWRHLTGEEPGEVRATGDQTSLALSARTPGGTLLATTISTETSDANDVELVGERGRMLLTLYRADGPHLFPTGSDAGGVGVRLRGAARSAATLPMQVRAARRGGDYLAAFAAEWASVRDAVTTGTPVHATLEDGRRMVELCLAAERSMAHTEPEPDRP